MSDVDLEKLAKKIKDARAENGLTQKQLAVKAGIGVNYYAQIEQGHVNPSYAHLQKIAKALGVKLSDIIPS